MCWTNINMFLVNNTSTVRNSMGKNYLKSQPSPLSLKLCNSEILLTKLRLEIPCICNFIKKHSHRHVIYLVDQKLIWSMCTEIRSSSVDQSSYILGMLDENQFYLLAKWEVLKQICLVSHLLFLLILLQRNVWSYLKRCWFWRALILIHQTRQKLQLLGQHMLQRTDINNEARFVKATWEILIPISKMWPFNLPLLHEEGKKKLLIAWTK